METLLRLIVSRSPRGWVGGQQAHLSSGTLSFAEGSSNASLFLRSAPALGDLPDPEIEPVSLTSSLTLAHTFFTTSATWEAP